MAVTLKIRQYAQQSLDRLDRETPYGLSYRTHVVVRTLSEKLQERIELTGKNPKSTAGAIVYLACVVEDQQIRQMDVANSLDTSDVSIRKAYHLILEILNKEPHEWHDMVPASLLQKLNKDYNQRSNHGHKEPRR